MPSLDNFKPIFKEKDAKNQFFYRNGEWVKCDEDTIMSLWMRWSVSSLADKFKDQDGFTVFGNYINKEEQTNG